MQDFTEKCVELELLHTVTSTPKTQVKLFGVQLLQFTGKSTV